MPNTIAIIEHVPQDDGIVMLQKVTSIPMPSFNKLSFAMLSALASQPVTGNTFSAQVGNGGRHHYRWQDGSFS